MKCKVKLNDLIILFFFIPCIVPAGLLEGGVVKLLFNSWRVAAFLLMIIYLIRAGQGLSKLLLCNVIFSAVIITSTCINHGKIDSSLSISMMMFTIIGLSDIQIKKDPRQYFRVIGCVSWFILAVDTIQVFTGIGFDCLDNSTWLGGDNFAIFTVLPMIGIIVVSDALTYGHARTATTLFCIFVALAKFKTFALTSMLAFVVLMLCLCLGSHIAVSKRIKWLIVFITTVLLAFVCMNFTDIYMQFAALFGKEPNIEHSRIAIWQLSVKAIIRKPIIGYGVLDAYGETIAIAGEYWPTCSHTHNYILEILFKGGILGLASYALMFKDYFKALVRKPENGITALFKAFLVANLVLWITDSYYAQAPVYVLLVLASHIKLLGNYEFVSVKSKIIFA